MLKMIDVLDQNLVQSFIDSLSTQTEQLDELIEGILKTSNHDFDHAIQQFFTTNDAHEIAQALDINQDRLQEIQTGLAMQQENIADTAKIVALCLVLETDALNQVHVADSLEGYPI